MGKSIFLMLVVISVVFGDNTSKAEKYVSSGLTYYDLKDYSSAIKNVTKAIQLDPNYAKAYIIRGFAYFILKDYSSATKDARKACSLGNCDLLQKMGKYGYIKD